MPERFGGPGAEGLDAYFAMARGSAGAHPLEMTKWLDTNYHYLVPELAEGQAFRARPGHWAEQIAQARQLGIATRPVVLGPFSFLRLSKGLARPLEALDALVPAYAELLARHGRGRRPRGADRRAVPRAGPDRRGARRGRGAPSAPSRRAAPRASPGDLLRAASSPRPSRGSRPCRWASCTSTWSAARRSSRRRSRRSAGTPIRLSLGVVDGRNVWATDLDAALGRIDAAAEALGGDRLTIAPSCSLLHVPYEAARESGHSRRGARLARLRRRAARRAGRAGRGRRRRRGARDELLAPSRGAGGVAARLDADQRPAVRARAGRDRRPDTTARAPVEERRRLQRAAPALPELPTTTIGSFPQTDAIRARAPRPPRAPWTRPATASWRSGSPRSSPSRSGSAWTCSCTGSRSATTWWSTSASSCAGFAFSDHGWVQSYGSRCVKPPILYGDVSRPSPMTVGWWRYAQSLTEPADEGDAHRPGHDPPVVVRARRPAPRGDLRQIALAIQDEVLDLERAGAAVIQVDEAALREGLPLRAADQDDYLRWAVDCFRLTTAPVRDETQVHTHMCYSEFNGIMDHIARLDADVLSIEASRSGMEVLDAFAEVAYPGDVGPGVYDIHSPRVPSADEIERLLELAEARIGRDRLWANPDCGLKTRGWPEAEAALANLVEAAGRRRALRPAVA